MLGAAGQLGGDAGAFEFRLEDRNRPLDIVGAHVAAKIDETRKLVIPLGLEGLECEILELPLHLPDPQSFRQRRIDLEGLARDPSLLLRRERGKRPHVVKSVAELDQHDADVLRHRQEHLADVLRMLLLGAERRELAELGHAIDKGSDFVAEAFGDLCRGHARVLGDIVKEGRDEGRCIEAEIGEDQGGFGGVRDVRLARGADLLAMRLDREEEGVVDLAHGLGGADCRAHLLAEGRSQGFHRPCQRTNLGDRIGGAACIAPLTFQGLRFDAHGFGG